MSKTEQVGACLAELSTLCDTGYALAIHIRMASPTLMYQTYPEEWIRRYSERVYMLSDPVVRWGLRETGFIRWRDIPDEDYENIYAQAREFGIEHGVAFSIGPASSRTLAGLTRSTVDFTGEEIDRMIGLVTQIHDLASDAGDELPALRALAPSRLG